MSGAPDYGPGDNIVCVGLLGPCSRGILFVGRAFTCDGVMPGQSGRWLCRLKGFPYDTNEAGHFADLFRRLDPKPPEFFAGHAERVKEVV